MSKERSLDRTLYVGRRLIERNMPQLICVDGPSGAGKSSLVKFLHESGSPISWLDTNLFMRERAGRENIPGRLYEKWYRADYFKDEVVKFFSTNKDSLQLAQAYSHDQQGTTGHSVSINLLPNRILVGRYSAHQEVADTLLYKGIKTITIIVDAPQSLRIGRVRERAKIQKNRDPDEQEALLREVVDPDWLMYFPTIFLGADFYISNTSNDNFVITRPRTTINRDHNWGLYATLHSSSNELTRMIEIGPGGETSMHSHEWLDEKYYIAHGILNLKLGSDEMVFRQGDTCSIPAGVPHKASCLDGQSVCYFETVTSTRGEITYPDIRKYDVATPRKGNLRFLQ